jgi:hypothetical protein
VTDTEKYSSLPLNGINYALKKFYDTGHRILKRVFMTIVKVSKQNSDAQFNPMAT